MIGDLVVYLFAGALLTGLVLGVFLAFEHRQ